jgi:hypothetical protein
MRYLLADKGDDADRLRRALREMGATPVIPGRRNRTSSAIAADTSSRMPSAVSKISAASPRATTSSPPTFFQARR